MNTFSTPGLPQTLALAFLACVRGSCSDSTAPLVPTAISITGYTGALTHQGQTLELSAQTTDQHGNPMEGVHVTWTAAHPAVVAVSSSGLVTAVSAGETTITARADAAQSAVQVRVDLIPTSMSILQGDGQQGIVGQVLAEELQVQVRDAGGALIQGAVVTFTVTAGNGMVSSPTSSTDREGQASATWTLGQTAGIRQDVVARAGEQIALFRAVGTPGPPVALEPQGPDTVVGYAGDPLDQPVRVLVSDAFGNGVPEIPVQWQVVVGDGSVAPGETVSDSAGIARAEWWLGSQPGRDSLRAVTPGLLPVQIGARVLPNAVIEGFVSLEGAFLGPGRVAQGDLLSRLHPGAARAQGASDVSGPGMMAAEEAFAEGELLVRYRLEELGPETAPGLLRSVPSFARAVQHALVAQVAQSQAADRFELLGASPSIATARIRVRTGEDIDDVARVLRTEPNVIHVERNRMILRIDPVPAGEGPAGFEVPIGTDPSQPLAALSGDVSSPYSPSNDALWPWQAWHYEMIEAHEGWKFTRGDPGIVVAVVDDGFRYDHPEFNGQSVPGYSFVPSTPLPLCAGGSIPADGHGSGPGPDATTPASYHWFPEFQCSVGPLPLGGHGVHVAGTIAAAADNGGGGSGIAPGVRIMPVRVLNVAGMGSLYNIAQGIVFAAGFPVDDGQGGTVQAQVPARVINLSLGFSGYSSAMHSAVQAVHGQGVLLVAAAGNAGDSHPEYPAAFPEVVAVSALDPYLNLATYSSFGAHVELAAPGGETGFGPDHGVCSTYWHFGESRPSFTCIAGTSMAAPHVAAVAALIWAQSPGLSNGQVRQRLRDSAVPLGSGQPNQQFGYGLVHARRALNGGWPLPGKMWVSLRDDTGRTVAVEQAGVDGAFRFGRLANGTYRVFSGMDEFGDETIGVPPRVWGAFGGSATPLSIAVTEQATHEASHQVGLPLESASNSAPQEADELAMGGYIHALINPGSDVDFFRVRVPEGGRYVFETRGWYGACGFPLAVNTRLQLRSEGGAVLAENESIDSGRYLYCSRLELDLDPGTYLLRINAADGQPGYYRVLARPLR